MVICHYTYNSIQVAALAMLALLLAAIDGCDMSLRYIFVIHVGMHAPIRIIRIMDCQSGRSWEQHSVCGDDPSTQQSSHAAVYTLLHNFTLTLLSKSMPSFQPLVQ